jgi:hypothetical protein
MRRTLNLKDLIGAIGLQNNQIQMHLYTRTGEDVPISDGDNVISEEQMGGIKDVVETDDYIALPTSFEIHGSGASRRFKDPIRWRGIQDLWYAFRDKAYEEIAIAYTCEINRDSYHQE